MFTPQRKSGWSFTPSSTERTRSRLSNPRSVGSAGFGKGKSVVGGDPPRPPPPPPQGLLCDDGAEDGQKSSAEIEVWNRFRDAGMLDEGTMEKKDKEALLERVEKLEHELFDYQHNMGLLLIEKKEWTSECKMLQQELTEVEEILNREKSAHLFAVSEIEKREDNLRKALEVEKQCVNELEKALREMQSKHVGAQESADTKLVEARALKEEFQVKVLEVDSKMRSADARIAEINRKNSDVERKLQELATRESMLQKEQLLLNNEKKLQAEDTALQREDLMVWEKSLREGRERLAESQSLLSQMEKRITDREFVLMKREKDIEMLRESVEKANSSMQEKEDYINIRLTALAAKEKEIEFQTEALQRTEQDLRAKEEHLNARERVEIEKIIGDHKSALASKMHDFEIEISEKRKALDAEFEIKLSDVEKKDKIISRKEENLSKREESLKKKVEKLNNDQGNLDAEAERLGRLKGSLMLESMDIEKKNKQLTDDNRHLVTSRAEIDAERKAIEAEKVRLTSEQEKLKITEQERENHRKLQSKLKQEIDEYMLLKESITKEREELREERRKFESEWEALDEKRSTLSADERRLTDEKTALEKWKCAEELALKTEQQECRDEIQRELDDLRLKKEAFEAQIAHERSELLEKSQQQHADMVRELDRRKHELEIEMQRKLQDLESQYQHKESELNKEKKLEMDRINSLQDHAASEMQKMKVEQARLQREKEEHLTQRKKLKEDEHEMQNDIEMLRSLNRNLKLRREEFIKEREHFLKQTCKNCGSRVELILPAAQPLKEIEVPVDDSLLNDADLEDRAKAYQTADACPVSDGSPSSPPGGKMSWLKACTKKIFNLSPVKRAEDSVDVHDLGQNNGQILPYQANRSDEIDEAVKDPGTSHNVLRDYVDTNRNPSDCNVSDTFSERNIANIDEQNKSTSLMPLVEEAIDSQVHSSVKKKVQRGGRGTRRGGRGTRRGGRGTRRGRGGSRAVKRTNDPDYSLTNDVSQEDSGHTGRTTSASRKRDFSQASGADSEAQSESVSVAGRRKRRSVVSNTQDAGERRYNFRRTTIEGKGIVPQALTGKTKGVKTRKPSSSQANESSSHHTLEEQEEGISKAVPEDSMEVHGSQRSVADGIAKVHESSSQKIVEDNDVAASSGRILEINEDQSMSTLAGEEDGAYRTENDEESDDGDDDDESDSERHNASVGKKLWKFFTS